MIVKRDEPFYKRIYFTFINEWAQFFGHYNWKNWDWCLIQVMYENDIILGAYEIQIVIFGLGFCIRFTKSIKTKEMLDIEEQLKKIESGEAAKNWKDWEEVKKELFGNCCPRCYYKLDGSEDKDDKDKN